MSVLKVNGKEMAFENESMPGTILELLGRLGVNAATVVAEVDGQIVQRENFESTNLEQGQNIELVRFVPGG